MGGRRALNSTALSTGRLDFGEGAGCEGGGGSEVRAPHEPGTAGGGEHMSSACTADFCL